jgi:hypothetical protein
MNEEKLLELFSLLEPMIDEDFPHGVGENHGTCATDKYVTAARAYKEGLELLRDVQGAGQTRKAVIEMPRKKPYTEIGIRRVPCFRCGEPSSHQWQICALGNKYHGVCRQCDIKLNVLVLQFFGVLKLKAIIKVYKAERRQDD